MNQELMTLDFWQDIVGLVAQQVSIPWGLVCTAFLLLPALFLVPVAGKKRD